MTNTRCLRITASSVLFGFLFIFFVPVIYNPTMFQCLNGAFLCLTNPAGWKSLGFWLFHWGGAYSPGGAGDPQMMGYTFLPEGYFFVPGWLNEAGPSGAQLTAAGVVFCIALPVLIAAIGLLGPELVRRSRATRIAFTAVGAFIFALAALIGMSMISQGFHPLFALLGVTLGAMGGVMTMYGLQRWAFGPDVQSTEESAIKPGRTRSWTAACAAVIAVLAISGFTLAPVVQVRSAATVDVCDGGAACFSEHGSLSCVFLGFGETYTSGPGYGYQFLNSRC